jgi:hypothetical protein
MTVGFTTIPMQSVPVATQVAKHAALEIESGILIMCPSGGDVYIRGLVQGASTMKIVDLVQSGPHHHLIENLKFKGLFSNTLKRSDVIN